MNHVPFLEHFINEDAADFKDYADSPGLWIYIDRKYVATPVVPEYDRLVFWYDGKIIPVNEAHGLKWIKASDYPMPSLRPGWRWNYSSGWRCRKYFPQAFRWEKYDTVAHFFADIEVVPGMMIRRKDDVPELTGFLFLAGKSPGRHALVDGESPYFHDSANRHTEIFKCESGDLQELQAKIDHRMEHLNPPDGFVPISEGEKVKDYFCLGEVKESIFTPDGPRGTVSRFLVNGELLEEDYYNESGFLETGKENPPVWNHIPTILNP